jgi:Tfp pilus assembly protein PilN
MPRRINLVPPGERPRTTTNVGVLALLVVLVLVVFGLGFGYYILKSGLSDRKAELQTAQQQTAQLQAQVQALQQYATLQTKRQAAEKIVQQVYAGRTLVAGVLNDVSLVVPETVWFQTFKLSTADPIAATTNGLSPGAGAAAQAAAANNVFSVEGDTYSFEDVANFLVRLQLIPSLQNVALAEAGQPKGNTDPDKDVKGFTIHGTVVNTQEQDTPLPLSQVEVPSQ